MKTLIDTIERKKSELVDGVKSLEIQSLVVGKMIEENKQRENNNLQPSLLLKKEKKSRK